MDQADCFRLLFGPYRMPRCKVGHWLKCRLRGKVKVTGISDAPIPWPQTRRGGQRSLVLCGDLVKAVRREAAQAVARHFGVTPQTVSRWRKVLGGGTTNEGTSRLHRLDALGPAGDAARSQARAKDRDPGRRAKLAASKRRPRHVIEAMRRGRTGKPQSEEARRKMSEEN